MFKVFIMDPSQVIFEGNATSVILPGDQGEFEILDFHSPIISLLKEGDIIIDGYYLSIKKGVMKFCKEEMVALVEE